MMEPRIYLSPPALAGDEMERIKSVLESGWIAPLGPELNGFEEDISEMMNGRHVVGLSSGTAALHLALCILNVGLDDEVWVPSMTFIASANVVRYVGATPVFIDCDHDSWCMDPNLLSEELKKAAKINRLPKAIIAVDLYGQPASYAELLEETAQYDIPLISDAAESLGATYQNEPAGSFGRFAALSFNGNKIITTSGGGALICKNQKDAERTRYLSTQARLPAAFYHHEEVGYNYRLSNILAALGRSQFAALSKFVAKRRSNRNIYKKQLADQPAISFMNQPKDRESNAWLTCITIDPTKTDTTPEVVRKTLEGLNIESRRLWKPMHLQPVFSEAKMFRGSVCEDLFSKGLCLPSGFALTKDQIIKISETIKRALN